MHWWSSSETHKIFLHANKSWFKFILLLYKRYKASDMQIKKKSCEYIRTQWSLHHCMINIYIVNDEFWSEYQLGEQCHGTAFCIFALISSTGFVFVVAVLAQCIENKFSDVIQMKKKRRPRINWLKPSVL